MTVDPSGRIPPEKPPRDVLASIDASLKLLILILFAAAGVFGFWRWSEAREKEGQRRVYERCVEQNLRYSPATVECREP